jgi:hypothetical protein
MLQQENGFNEKKIAGTFHPSAIWSNGKVFFWDPVLNLNFQKVATRARRRMGQGAKKERIGSSQLLAVGHASARPVNYRGARA